MDQDSDLSSALVMLVEGKGYDGKALELARRWPDSWVARCLVFLVGSFFFVDVDLAAEPFGGMDGILQLMESERVERYFLRGYGAWFRHEPEEALAAFRAAAALEPDDPYVLFSLILCYAKHGMFDELYLTIGRLGTASPRHPLLFVLKDMFEKRRP